MIPYATVYGYLKVVDPTTEFIKQNQDGAKPPSLPYAAWSEISSTRISQEHVSYGEFSLSDSTYTENIDVPKLETIQIMFCSKTEKQAANESIVGYKSAYQLADEFLTRLRLNASKVYARSNNIGLMDYRDLSSFSNYLGDIHELRCPVEIILSFVSNQQQSIEKITSVSTTTTLQGI